MYSKNEIVTVKEKHVWEINLYGRTVMLFIAVIVFLSGIYFITRKVNGLMDWQKGIESVQKENWNEAIVYYDNARENIPHDGRLKFNIGAAYLNRGKSQDAIPYLEQSLLSFQDKNIFILLSIAYAETNQNIKAENILMEFSRQFPNLLLPHLLLGKLYYESSRIPEAKRELTFVIQNKSKFNNEYSKQIKNEAGNILRGIKSQDIMN